MKKELQEVLAAARELQDKYAEVLFSINIEVVHCEDEKAYDKITVDGYVVGPNANAWMRNDNDYSYAFYSFDCEDKMQQKLEALLAWFNGCEELKEKLMCIGRPKTPAEYEEIIAKKDERIEFLEGKLELQRKQQEGGAA